MKHEPIECCEVFETHAPLLHAIGAHMPDEEALCDVAELFKIFGDSSRIRILFALREGEVCVCDLAQALSMTQSAVSHQLRILKGSKLVRSRREGKQIFYSLADEHVMSIIAQGLEHVSEE